MNASSELCENSWYLREQSYKEDQLEQRWLASIPQMIEAIVEHSIKAMEMGICIHEFDWIFTRYVNSEEGYEQLSSVLDQWNEGEVDPEDEPFLHEVALIALEGSAEVLFNESLYEIASMAGFSINKMILEVIS